MLENIGFLKDIFYLITNDGTGLTREIDKTLK